MLNVSTGKKTLSTDIIQAKEKGLEILKKVKEKGLDMDLMVCLKAFEVDKKHKQSQRK